MSSALRCRTISTKFHSKTEVYFEPKICWTNIDNNMNKQANHISLNFAITRTVESDGFSAGFCSLALALAFIFFLNGAFHSILLLLAHTPYPKWNRKKKKEKTMIKTRSGSHIPIYRTCGKMFCFPVPIFVFAL